MHKTILIPIDIAHIEKAQSMIDIARSQSLEAGQIILLNVVEEAPNWVASTIPANILDEIERSAREHLTNVAKVAELDVTIEVRSGHPYQTILQVAGEFNADLIIVASHKPGMQDYFLGSTAAKVVRHAKCSVLVER